jgi:hypothetical protein
MKLFFLIIPLVGIQCIYSVCGEKTKIATAKYQKERVETFQFLPANIFMHFK